VARNKSPASPPPLRLKTLRLVLTHGSETIRGFPRADVQTLLPTIDSEPNAVKRHHGTIEADNPNVIVICSSESNVQNRDMWNAEFAALTRL